MIQLSIGAMSMNDIKTMGEVNLHTEVYDGKVEIRVFDANKNTSTRAILDCKTAEGFLRTVLTLLESGIDG